MSMIEDIKRDHEASPTFRIHLDRVHTTEPNQRRIARVPAMEAALLAAEKGLRDVISMLDDPTGDEHVRDMRGAKVIARATLAKITAGKP